MLRNGLHQQLIEVDGRQRNYLLYIPADMPAADWPVVIAFHGNGTNAQSMLPFTALHEKAEQAKFLAVFPNGTGRLERARSFNAGNCCGYALRHQIDDVKFVATMLDDLQGIAPTDPTRSYATGMSNGALMCYLLADRLSHRIAAIAPVAGPMGFATCSPSRPVPVCHFHGTADTFACYHGGRGRHSTTGTDFYSVPHTIACWVEANGCQRTPVEEELDANVSDGTRITRATYLGDAPASEVVLYTIHGGGHTWPGATEQLKFLGTTTANLSANDRMWEFFERHRLEYKAGRSGSC